MDTDCTIGSRQACQRVASAIVLAIMTICLQGCSQSTSESDTQPRRPQQAGQPVNTLKVASQMTAARSSMALGDSKAAESHVNAITNDISRSARMPNPHNPIDHESARAAVRPILGVRSSVWMDRENLVVMVDGASHRSMEMIDTVCLALEPLGDTLAVVINVQDVTATTPDGATTLSRNCQLREGQRALFQKKREVDVVSRELRETHKKQQAQK